MCILDSRNTLYNICRKIEDIFKTSGWIKKVNNLTRLSFSAYVHDICRLSQDSRAVIFCKFLWIVSSENMILPVLIHEYKKSEHVRIGFKLYILLLALFLGSVIDILSFLDNRSSTYNCFEWQTDNSIIAFCHLYFMKQADTFSWQGTH